MDGWSVVFADLAASCGYEHVNYRIRYLCPGVVGEWSEVSGLDIPYWEGEGEPARGVGGEGGGLVVGERGEIVS